MKKDEFKNSFSIILLRPCLSLLDTKLAILSILSPRYEGITLLNKVILLPFLSLCLTLDSSLRPSLFLVTIDNILSIFSLITPCFAVEPAGENLIKSLKDLVDKEYSPLSSDSSSFLLRILSVPNSTNSLIASVNLWRSLPLDIILSNVPPSMSIPKASVILMRTLFFSCQEVSLLL